VIGLPPAQVFQVANVAPFSPPTGIGDEDALHTALTQRPDYKGARKLVEAAQQTLAAARAEWYPTLDLNGYYGDVGPRLNNSHGVFFVTAALNFNIYTGGHIRADTEKARAALKRRSDELADLGARIEVEVRDAFLDLRSTADQVSVARDNLGLANQTLDQARDRFSAGVTDNIEVVQAQGSVAIANDNLISASQRIGWRPVLLGRLCGPPGSSRRPGGKSRCGQCRKPALKILRF
jgi:outer membrane protein TolC